MIGVRNLGAGQEYGGKPLGVARFERESGIKPHEWERFSARFGDALLEAGFPPNQLQGAYEHDFLFDKLITLIRKLKKFPTYREIAVERVFDPDIPGKKVFARLGSKDQLADKVSKYCATKAGCEDVIKLCSLVLKKNDHEGPEINGSASTVGEVYLFKHGRYYKIGKTNNTVRRGAELRIQLPEKMHLIHSIKTDDPSGIEAYWHKRFEARRMNGEWFDLNIAEVRAFKRWKRIV